MQPDSNYSMIKSFGNAFSGFFHFLKTERNAIIHLIATIIVIVLALYFQLQPIEWIVLLLCIAAVISFEMINTAIEHLCDVIQPRYHPSIKIIKDIAAGAVLVISLISFIISLIIFVPKIQLPS